jgi:hypothetical protein
MNALCMTSWVHSKRVGSWPSVDVVRGVTNTTPGRSTSSLLGRQIMQTRNDHKGPNSASYPLARLNCNSGLFCHLRATNYSNTQATWLVEMSSASRDIWSWTVATTTRVSSAQCCRFSIDFDRYGLDFVPQALSSWLKGQDLSLHWNLAFKNFPFVAFFVLNELVVHFIKLQLAFEKSSAYSWWDNKLISVGKRGAVCLWRSQSSCHQHILRRRSRFVLLMVCFTCAPPRPYIHWANHG